jgi:hypothetical protein
MISFFNFRNIKSGKPRWDKSYEFNAEGIQLQANPLAPRRGIQGNRLADQELYIITKTEFLNSILILLVQKSPFRGGI